MTKYLVCQAVIALTLFANPQVERIINEFQTNTSGYELMEFHPTFMGGESLRNLPVATIAGTALIDTSIYLPNNGYVLIDESMLYGPFALPSDTGFIRIYVDYWFQDSIFYPIFDSLPGATSSAAKFSWTIGYDIIDEYLIQDWYIDHSPTFGFQNDDYRGCRVSGTVLGNGVPLANANLSAVATDSSPSIPESLYFRKSTTSGADGSYSFQYLFPIDFDITASAPGYTYQSLRTPRLHSMDPLTDFNFELYQTGVDNRDDAGRPVSFTISGNPFREKIDVKLISSRVSDEYPVKIFDVSCRLVRSLPVRTNFVSWDGRDEYGRRVNPGIYFMLLPNVRIKLIKIL